VRETSGAPTKSAISGETRLGFIMPLGARFPVDAVAQVTTVRPMRRLTGRAARVLREGEDV